jgi:peptide/nickel transport system substrate-binding protein
MIRLTSLAAGLAATAAISLAPPAVADDATPVRGGILTYALTAEPPNFDCTAGATFGVLQTVRPHYSGLIKFDPDRYPDVMPDLADKWEISPDRLTYTFHLRRGVKFHDGSPMTSEDVRVTFERIRNPPDGVVSIRKARYQSVRAIEAPDPYTIVFRLSQPDSAMIGTLASPWNCVIPAAKVKADPKWPERNIIGTGPFKFAGYTPGADWRGVRFDDYFEPGKPYLDGYHVIFMKSAAVANAIRGGQVDGFFVGTTPPEAQQLKSALGDKIVVEQSPYLTKYDLFFNAQRKPFDDARVRRALSLAIDRWTGIAALSKISTLGYVGGVLRPGGKYATSPDELAKLPGFGHDAAAARAEAKRLLAEAGVPNLKFKLTTRDLDTFGPVIVYLVDQWRRIGVTAEPETMPVGPQKARYLSGNYDVGYDADSYEDDEPNDLLSRYISAERSPRNFSHYGDSALDALYDKQRLAADDTERTRLIAEFQARAIDQAWIVPIGWLQRLAVHTSALHGWKALPSQYLNQDLTNVWLARPQK